MGKKLIIKGANFYANRIPDGGGSEVTYTLTPVLYREDAILDRYVDYSDVTVVSNQYTGPFNVYKIDVVSNQVSMSITTECKKTVPSGYKATCVAVFNSNDVCIKAYEMSQGTETPQTFEIIFGELLGASYVLVDCGLNKPIPTGTGIRISS